MEQLLSQAEIDALLGVISSEDEDIVVKCVEPEPVAAVPAPSQDAGIRLCDAHEGQKGKALSPGVYLGQAFEIPEIGPDSFP